MFVTVIQQSSLFYFTAVSTNVN